MKTEGWEWERETEENIKYILQQIPKYESRKSRYFSCIYPKQHVKLPIYL